MKLLFDQNLSHKLPARLKDLFPHSEHVRSRGMERAPDEVVWIYAKTHGLAIVTQDADFSERSRLFGAPPKIIWLRCGNTTPAAIEQMLRSAYEAIVELERDPEHHVLELVT